MHRHSAVFPQHFLNGIQVQHDPDAAGTKKNKKKHFQKTVQVSTALGGPRNRVNSSCLLDSGPAFITVTRVRMDSFVRNVNRTLKLINVFLKVICRILQ